MSKYLPIKDDQLPTSSQINNPFKERNFIIRTSITYPAV